MKLVACPDCVRPYDVVGLEPGTKLRCICGGRMKVGIGDPLAGGVSCGHCGAPVPAGQGTCAHCNAALLKARCPHCGTTSPEGSLHCCRCGQELVCHGLKALPAKSSCPRCRHELGLRILPRGSAIECPSCDGIWLEPEDLERMTRVAAAAPTTGSKEVALSTTQPLAYLPCVRCGQLMQRRQFRWGHRATRIVLDYCRDHGVWLDGGELEAVLAHASELGHVAHGAAPVPRASAAERTYALKTRPERGLLRCFLDSVVEIFNEAI